MKEKTSWNMSLEQLEEWKELISKGDSKTVSEQIDDILRQVKEHNDFVYDRNRYEGWRDM